MDLAHLGEAEEAQLTHRITWPFFKKRKQYLYLYVEWVNVYMCMIVSKARKGSWVPLELGLQVVGSCPTSGSLSKELP